MYAEGKERLLFLPAVSSAFFGGGRGRGRGAGGWDE